MFQLESQSNIDGPFYLKIETGCKQDNWSSYSAKMLLVFFETFPHSEFNIWEQFCAWGLAKSSDLFFSKLKHAFFHDNTEEHRAISRILLWNSVKNDALWQSDIFNLSTISWKFQKISTRGKCRKTSSVYVCHNRRSELRPHSTVETQTCRKRILVRK
jgi:hypothetical protein